MTQDDNDSPVAQEDAAERLSLQRARSGDAEAFAALVRTHHRRVRAYLSASLGRADIADDLAQEVFLSAFRALRDYRPDAPFVHWLLGIARNRARWYLRDERRRKELNSELFDSLIGLPLANGGGDTDAMLPLRDKEISALLDCIGQLPDHSGALVEEHYFAHRPLVDIARHSGRKESTLRMSLLRTRKSLAECVRLKLESTRKRLSKNPQTTGENK